MRSSIAVCALCAVLLAPDAGACLFPAPSVSSFFNRCLAFSVPELFLWDALFAVIWFLVNSS